MFWFERSPFSEKSWVAIKVQKNEYLGVKKTIKIAPMENQQEAIDQFMEQRHQAIEII